MPDDMNEDVTGEGVEGVEAVEGVGGGEGKAAVAGAAPVGEATETPSDMRPTLYEVRQADKATIALVAGEAVTEVPTDLYIPPDALEVFLETFEGPLDLLLYLIRKQNLDILSIEVAKITEQYVQYIELMSALQLELAGEYLVMAAMLAEIKSRMLLPKPETVEDEDDPRAELIRRLLEYEQIKSGAENIAELPRMERDLYPVAADKPELVRQHAEPEVDLREVLLSLAQVLKRAEMFEKHSVQYEPLSVRERMSDVLSRIRDKTDFVEFVSLFPRDEGRMGVIVTFLAVMELVREALVEFVQNEPFAPIYVRVYTATATEEGEPGDTSEKRTSE